MSSDDLDALLDREDVLRGMPARRAATALFLIEARTAYMVHRAHREVNPVPLDSEADERENAFLEAFAQGASPRTSVTIQQIEQYAASWAGLMPDPPRVRAALAHRFGEKYTFTRAAVPGIRGAIGLDVQDLGTAYLELYDRPLSTIYAPRVPLSAQPGWYWRRASAWLEGIHPFWIAFALTLPVGPGLMALPIALAGVGPLVGIGLIVLFAVINRMTVAALAEAVARSGITRYGQGYLGQLVADWLGPAGSIFLTFAFAVDGVLILPVFYLGIATTLAQATGVVTEIWVAVIFAVGLYFLSRRTLSTTVASTLVIVTINVCLLITIPLVTALHISGARLTYMAPVLGIGAFPLIFGTMLSNFFAHQQIANYGRVVLRRDPDARYWIAGCRAAITATAVISALWIVTVDGALTANVLQHERGTVVAALGMYVNPAISILGSALVILSLGMTTIHISLGLLFTTKERLPRRIRLDPRLGVVIPILPVAVIFLMTEWLSIVGLISFASLLGFVTVMTLTTLGAFFPILLVIAGRRKSDLVLHRTYGPLDHEAVLAALYALFLGVVWAYGLFIWNTVPQRAVTLVAALAISAGTIIVIRRGMLRRRLVVEIRDSEDPAIPPGFAVLCAGQPVEAGVTIEGAGDTHREIAAAGHLPVFSRLQAIHLDLPPSSASEMKIWVHRVSSLGETAGLPAVVSVGEGEAARIVEMDLAEGWIVVPIDGQRVRVSVQLSPGRATSHRSVAELLAGDA